MTLSALRLDAERLRSLSFPERTFAYDETRTMLYGLGAGMGLSPLDSRELPFVTEKGIKALPTMATVIAWDDGWLRLTGIEAGRAVHGEQRVTLHKPIAPQGTVSSTLRILDVFDKGAGGGAVLYVRSDLTDVSDGQPLATLHSTVFARGYGGFGGPTGNPPPLANVPDRPCDELEDCTTLPCQALLFRLLGDRNPLHSDPDFARAAGYDRPILHGLCTYAIAAKAILTTLCEYDPSRLKHIEGRFTAPVYPGETIRTEIWRTPEGAAFRALAAGRDSVIVDRGRAVLG
jgi:acyl dehydratase